MNLDNCLILAANADVCLTCAENYILTTDSIACLPKVTNCKTYITSSGADQELICNTCDDFFYLDSTTFNCASGSISNCTTYNKNEDICSICTNKFYKSTE